MKAVCLLLLIGSVASLFAQNPHPLISSSGARSKTNSTALKSSPYAITERGPNHRIWQRVTATTNTLGKIVRRTNSVTELATGMHYWDGQKWLPSNPSFQEVKNGFAATQTQHKVHLNRNIGVSKAVSVTTQDGVQLQSTPLGIGLYDAASGNFLLIGQITNSAGYLVGSNRVVYPNAFNGVCADIVYTMKSGSFHQDVLFTGQIDPTVYGFPKETTRLQILTEFYDAPNPKTRNKTLQKEKNQAVRTKLASPDLVDQTLGFAQFVLGAGSAYLSDSTVATNHHPPIGPPVAKAFIPVNNRQILVESIDYPSISKFIAGLPPCNNGRSAQFRVQKAEIAYNQLPHLDPNPVISPAPSAPSVRSAVITNLRPGFVMDYAAVVGDIDDDFTFQSDTTYFISGEVSVPGNCTFEGGAVLKYPLSLVIDSDDDLVFIPSSLSVGGVSTYSGSRYRPTILTASDDDSVGDSLSGIDPYYTGDPFANGSSYGMSYFSFLDNFKNMRASFAQIFSTCGEIDSPMTWDNMQFANCGAVFFGVGGDGSTPLIVNNCLFANVGNAFCGDFGDFVFSINNCTFDNLVYFDSFSYSWLGGQDYFSATNSIFSNLGIDPGVTSISGDFNGFYNFGGTPFGSDATNITSSPFQPTGAGNYYLASSTFQALGTTNIDPSLLAEIRKKTTYAPSFLTNTITTDTVLGPLVPRDTNMSLDLGYHYDPIDYLTAVAVTNATLVLTNGVVLAWDDLFGINFTGESHLISQGSAGQNNYLVYYRTVQEQTTPFVVTPVWFFGQQVLNSIPAPLDAPLPPPDFRLSFTTISFLGVTNESWTIMTVDDADGIGNFLMDSCEIYGGGAVWSMNNKSGSAKIGLRNNLFHRVNQWIQNQAPITLTDNTFIGGRTEIDTWSGPSSNSVVNNAFDNLASVYLSGTTGYNGYLNGSLGGDTNVGDIITNLVWVAGPLGSYYQPTNSPLIDAGNTTADLVGLYQFTTQTNQVKEANSLVDIGYHYVALDGSGNPVDTDGDGIPDYIADANGNGLWDNGEIDWMIMLTDPNNIGPTGLQVYTPLKY